MIKGAFTKLRQITAVVSGWIGAYASMQLDREAFKNWRPRPATATQAIAMSLTTLVAQCRHLERTTAWGRAISDALSSDIVGTGIDILPNTGSDELDAQVVLAFHEWAEHAMADGSSLWAWQAMGPREVAAAGNVLARWVVLPERLQAGWLPICILPLETEWISEIAVAPIDKNNRFIRGLEVDSLGRVKFFHLRNPETLNFFQGERVAADQIIHCFERRRAQQIFGEPILAPAVERILQDDRLVRSELQGSVNASAPALAITSEYHQGQTDDNGDPVTDIPAGSTVRLLPGEDVKAIAPTRPNEKLAPFRNSIRGDIAGCTRTSQFWIDRDASRANYSSMRMDQLLTKRALGMLKEIIGQAMAGNPYQKVFPWLMLSIGAKLPSDSVDLAKMMRYDLRPDQPEYVDPTKDVQASINAIANNLSSYDLELSARGKDWRVVFRQRQLENALLLKCGLPLPQPEKSAKPEKDSALPDGTNADIEEPATEVAA